MTDTLSVEFLYESGSTEDIVQSLWETFDADESTEAHTEFDGEEFTFEIDADEEGLFATLRIPDQAGNTRAPSMPHLEVLESAEYLRQMDDPSAEIDGIVSGIAAIYESLSPTPDYVYGLDAVHAERLWEGDLPLPVTPASLANDRIQDVSWLMIFPPALVESYGREFLMDAPAWRSTELQDGGICLVAFENPAEFEAHDDLEELREYFDR